MARSDLAEIEAWSQSVTGPNWTWYAKYLSANDTLATKSHQYGVLIAANAIRAVFPNLLRRVSDDSTPDAPIDVQMGSHAYARDCRIVWYESKGEGRITKWGGLAAPILEPNATGSLVLFAFYHQPDADAEGASIWLCRSVEEEDWLLDRIGDVEPAGGLVYRPLAHSLDELGVGWEHLPCAVTADTAPPEWLKAFPTGEEIVAYAAARRPDARRMVPDQRLLSRRECETAIFHSLESLAYMPRIREGFETIEIFAQFANEVLNRRKSRAGGSLELQARLVFDEEAVPYTHKGRTEGKRTPDFIFPSVEHYHDLTWNDTKLRILAAKTTCKDRWRQVLAEAQRTPVKHLLTLQPGVSRDQFEEMREEGVVLVVPEELHQRYPEIVRPHLLTFHGFIDEVRALVA